MTSSPSVPRTGLAIGLVLSVMFAFAVMDGLTKMLTQTLPITQVLLVRSLVLAVLAVGLLRWRSGVTDVPFRVLAESKRPWLQFSRALLLVVESFIYMVAFKLLPLADVHAVSAVSPLMVVALSVPFLGERVGLRRWIAILIGLVGVLVIVRPELTTLHPATLITLAGAALWAIYQIMVRLCARVDSNETTALWTAMVGLGAASVAGATSWTWPDATGWVLLAAIALLGAYAHIAFISALALTEPSLLQPFSYSLFVWAIVIGFLLFGDVPDGWTLTGAVIIIAAGLYAWYRERVRAGDLGQHRPAGSAGHHR